MLHHAIRIDAKAGLALGLLLQVGPDVHAGGVPPQEEGFFFLGRALHEIHCLGIDFHVDGFHALLGQRAGVGDGTAREAMNDTAGTEFFLEGRILRIVGIFRLFLGIQVIEIAKEFVEAMRGRQHAVQVAKVILAELTGDIAFSLEQSGDRRISRR